VIHFEGAPPALENEFAILCSADSVKPWYGRGMRNITVSVPDDIYRQARIKSAEQGRSVSALVAEFLATLGDSGDEFERLLARQEEVLAEIESFRAGDRLRRDEIHERALR
jgi:plasmid stability protein